MKLNIIYYNNYKSAFRSNSFQTFSHSSMITPRPLSLVLISVLVLLNESVSNLSPGGENPCLISFRRRRSIETVDSIDSNGIPFHHQTKKIDKLMVLRLLETP